MQPLPIIGPISSGKTDRLIAQFKQSVNGKLIVSCEAQRTFCQQWYGIEAEDVFTHEEAIQLIHKGVKPPSHIWLFLDDAESFLQTLLNYRLQAFSVTTSSS